MNEIILKPIRERRSDYEDLKEYILKLFKQELYFPLLKELNVKKSFLNSSTKTLVDALIIGHIRYEGNGFAGVFSAEVSKELRRLGAVWSKRGYKWLIRAERLPIDVQAAVSQSDRKEAQLKSKITRILDTLSPATVLEKFDATKFFENTTKHVEQEFQKSVASIAIAPKMSVESKKRISEEYSENLKLYIKEFTNEEILRLRKSVENHVFSGQRYESLATEIQASYGISQRKAQFLARQETSLLSAKIRETRYADVGIDEYIWQAVVGTLAHPTRKMHQALNGTRQRFSDPPVDDPKGTKHNPGENYNCRCVARPVVKF